jgi:hypothetical protein
VLMSSVHKKVKNFDFTDVDVLLTKTRGERSHRFRQGTCEHTGIENQIFMRIAVR